MSNSKRWDGYTDQSNADLVVKCLEEFASKIRDGGVPRTNLTSVDRAIADYQLARAETEGEE